MPRGKYRPVPGPPNRQPFVMLRCKCIVLAWPVFTGLAGHRPEGICDTHGWQRIKGLLTLEELLEWSEPDNQEKLW